MSSRRPVPRTHPLLAAFPKDELRDRPAGPEGPFYAIVQSPRDSALSDRDLIYAMSTITGRAPRDLRDGLKPVPRCLLWAIRLLKPDPASAYKKCAFVVDDVIGKYHPHGDQSVDDAMVRRSPSVIARRWYGGHVTAVMVG